MFTDRHFEILGCKRGSWTVHAVETSRKAAIEQAHGLLEDRVYAELKVVDSHFDEASGMFRETVITHLKVDGARSGTSSSTGGQRRGVVGGKPIGAGATAGQGTNDRVILEPTGDTRLCSEPDDLCTPEARRLIAQVLASRLESWVITPLELLHSMSHYKRLENAGTVMQQAVQQGAIAAAKNKAITAPALVKRLHKTVDLARDRLEADLQSDPVRTLGFEQILNHTDLDPADRTRYAYIRLCDHLREAKDWSQKLVAMIDAMGERPSPAALTLADGLVAEILTQPQGLTTVLSVFQRGLQAAARMEAARVGQASTTEPGTTGRGKLKPLFCDCFDLLDGAFLPDTGIITPEEFRTLFAWIGAGGLPLTASALLRRMRQEIESSRALINGKSDDLIGEARAISEINRRLRTFEERYARFGGVYEDEGSSAETPIGEQCRLLRAALETRSEVLLRPERLGTWLAEGGSLWETMPNLLGIAHNLVGAVNQRRIGKYIIGRINQDMAEARLAEIPPKQLFSYLKKIATWLDDLENLALPRDIQTPLTSLLDRVAVEMMNRGQVLKSVARQNPDPVDAALALFNLVHSNIIPRGTPWADTRQHLAQYIQRAGGAEAFVRSLATRDVPPEKLMTIQKFMR